MDVNGQGADVVVAGHICLDIIPSFRTEGRNLDDLFFPGKLIDVGSALMATGGAVGNTGIALHRLGIRTVLIGKIGRDPFGAIVADLLKGNDHALTNGMIIDDNCTTSYTIVISPPDRDRLFFHYPGANDTFINTDIADEHLSGIRNSILAIRLSCAVCTDKREKSSKIYFNVFKKWELSLLLTWPSRTLCLRSDTWIGTRSWNVSCRT